MFDNLDDPAKKDQKLSLLEKGIIVAGTGLLKVIMWKLGKAKTYGDVNKLGEFIGNKIDMLEDKYSEEELSGEAGAETFRTEINESQKEIKEL